MVLCCGDSVNMVLFKCPVGLKDGLGFREPFRIQLQCLKVGEILREVSLCYQAAGTPKAIRRNSGERFHYGALGVMHHFGLAVGRRTMSVMGRRNAGRAEYDPLRLISGGGGRKPTPKRKKANMDVGFFLPCSPQLRLGAVPPPLSRL